MQPPKPFAPLPYPPLTPESPAYDVIGAVNYLLDRADQPSGTTGPPFQNETGGTIRSKRRINVWPFTWFALGWLLSWLLSG